MIPYIVGKVSWAVHCSFSILISPYENARTLEHVLLISIDRSIGRSIDRLTDCLGPEYFLRRLAKKSSSWVNKKPGGLGVRYIDKSGPVQLFAGEAFDEETRVGLRKGFREDEKQGRGERKRKGRRRRQRKKQDGSRRVLGGEDLWQCLSNAIPNAEYSCTVYDVAEQMFFFLSSFFTSQII